MAIEQQLGEKSGLEERKKVREKRREKRKRKLISNAQRFQAATALVSRAVVATANVQNL